MPPLVLLVVSCASPDGRHDPTSVPQRLATSVPASEAVGAARPPTSIPPSPTPPPRVEALIVGVRFETFEAEETIQHELGALPGVQAVVVAQFEITVRYDPTKLTEQDVMRVVRANPEVRVQGDPRRAT